MPALYMVIVSALLAPVASTLTAGWMNLWVSSLRPHAVGAPAPAPAAL